MTTHDEQTNTTTTPTADDDSAARQEYSSPGTEPATAQPRQSAAAEPSSATMRTDPPTADDDSAARQEYSSAGTEPATAQPRQSAAAEPSSAAMRTDLPTADDDVATRQPAAAQPRQSAAAEPSSATVRTDPPAAQTERSGTETGMSTDQSRTNSLFADDTSGLRSRWDDVQAAFVDDPKECVQKADTLVAEVVEQLTNGFSEARSRLEAQWSRGEEASTEDLRLALKRYREFFQRLLSV